MENSGKKATALVISERVKSVTHHYAPRDTAKALAQASGAEVTTAKGWADHGKWMHGKHLAGLVREFGSGVLIALFEPEIEEHERKLDAQIALLEARKGLSKARRAAALSTQAGQADNSEGEGGV